MGPIIPVDINAILIRGDVVELRELIDRLLAKTASEVSLLAGRLDRALEELQDVIVSLPHSESREALIERWERVSAALDLVQRKSQSAQILRVIG